MNLDKLRVWLLGFSTGILAGVLLALILLEYDLLYYPVNNPKVENNRLENGIPLEEYTEHYYPWYRMTIEGSFNKVDYMTVDTLIIRPLEILVFPGKNVWSFK